jgi:hypothetical protein
MVQALVLHLTTIVPCKRLLRKRRFNQAFLSFRTRVPSLQLNEAMYAVGTAETALHASRSCSFQSLDTEAKESFEKTATTQLANSDLEG